MHNILWSKEFGLMQRRRQAFLEMTRSNFVGASRECVSALWLGGFQPADCSNLGFISHNYLSAEERKDVADKIWASNINRDASLGEIFLKVSILLGIDREYGRQRFENKYLNAILRPSVKETLREPVLFWHVPKCSGTSLCWGAAWRFYGKPLKDVIPGYTYASILKLLIEEYSECAPFISANHLYRSELEVPETTRQFTILRDPVKRARSMYRQEMSERRIGRTVKRVAMSVLGPKQALRRQRRYYRILPRYRHFWDYRKDTDFDSWLNNIPESLLMAQLATFSHQMEADDAAQAVRSMDGLLFDPDASQMDPVLKKLGLGIRSSDLPADLNSSDKKVRITDKDLRGLEERLEREIAFVDKIR